jgi:DNA-binding LacI/PurR family transcriptional regulator
MARSPGRRNARPSARPEDRPFSLKKLADYLGLAPATVSLVLNRSPVADTISEETKKIVFAGARKFDYRPNFFARCLRTRRSFTIGVMVPEVSEGYNAAVLGGIEDQLMHEGFLFRRQPSVPPRLDR